MVKVRAEMTRQEFPAGVIAPRPPTMHDLLVDCKAMADGTRLRIMRLLLLSGPFHVNEIVTILQVPQPGISRHLRILSAAGLIQARRHGTHVIYSFPDQKAIQIQSKARTDLISALRRAAPDRDFFGADSTRAEKWLAVRDQQLREERDQIGPRWYSIRDEYLGALDEADLIGRHLGHAAVVVDLGSGDGRLLCALPTGRDYIGIDRSEVMIRTARTRAQRDGRTDLQFRLGDLEHLPLPDRSVDAVIACMVLHHVDDPLPVLTEISRALRPGGRFILLDFRTRRDEAGRKIGFSRHDLGAWCDRCALSLDSWRDIRAGVKFPLILATAVPAAGRPHLHLPRRTHEHPDGT
jgi:SAM-dependent methyltransferase